MSGRGATPGRYFLWLLMTVSLLQGTGYWLFSGIGNLGNWAKVIEGLTPAWPARVRWRSCPTSRCHPHVLPSPRDMVIPGEEHNPRPMSSQVIAGAARPAVVAVVPGVAVVDARVGVMAGVAVVGTCVGVMASGAMVETMAHVMRRLAVVQAGVRVVSCFAVADAIVRVAAAFTVRATARTVAGKHRAEWGAHPRGRIAEVGRLTVGPRPGRLWRLYRASHPDHHESSECPHHPLGPVVSHPRIPFGGSLGPSGTEARARSEHRPSYVCRRKFTSTG
jgi:hypothetical protein